MRPACLVAACFVIAGCAGSTAEVPPPAAAAPEPVAVATPPSTPIVAPVTAAEAQQKAMAEYVAAWDARDAQKAASYFTENGVITMAGAPDAAGRDAILATIKSNFAASDDAKVPFTRLFTQGDVMIGEWTWVGTHTGDLMGLPATHKPFGVMGVSVYLFTPDAKLAEAHVYFDAGTLLSQLGASAQKARPLQALPSGEATTVAATGSAEEQRNLETATQMMGAYEKKKAAQLTASMSPDIAWDDMSEPETRSGVAAAKKYFKTRTQAFPDAKVTIRNAWAVGDQVLVESTFTGTQKGALGAIRATKKPVTLHQLDVLQFDADGKLVHQRSYANSTELAMQLGLVPPPGAGSEQAAATK